MLMGRADVAVRRWLGDKERFADLFNGTVFQGEEVVLAEDLEEQKGESSLIVTDKNKNEKAVQNYRDIVMRWNGKLNLAVLAVETQDKIHYAMPVRNMVYDGLDYAEQVRKVQKEHKGKYTISEEFLSGFNKEDKIYPVITLVFYYDTKKWDAAKDLYDMMGLEDEIKKHPLLKQYIPNYHINLVDAGRIEEGKQFRTDLHEVLGMLRYRGDKEGLQKYMSDHEPYFSNLDKDSYYAIGSFLQSKRLLKKIEENNRKGKEMRLDMCKALEELYADGIEQGKRDTAINLKKMGMTVDQIAQAVGEDGNVVRGWLEGNAANSK